MENAPPAAISILGFRVSGCRFVGFRLVGLRVRVVGFTGLWGVRV